MNKQNNCLQQTRVFVFIFVRMHVQYTIHITRQSGACSTQYTDTCLNQTVCAGTVTWQFYERW